jgi:D-psicose/D-tagatose/L-ribulose 3-epimerase
LTFHGAVRRGPPHIQPTVFNSIVLGSALKKWAGYHPLIHVSDNNRLFPGLGAIDFATIFGALKKMGFEGTMAIEGNLQRSFAEDIRTSAQFLSRLPAS